MNRSTKRPLQHDSLHDELPSTSQQQLVCYHCGTTQTPQWREGPQGPKTLCNACGVRAYRQAKRSRKGGAHGGAARSGLQRQRLSGARRGHHLTGDSGDELTVTYCTMSDHSTEDSEEQLAALSLLCFAGLQPVGEDLLDQGHEEGLQAVEEKQEEGRGLEQEQLLAPAAEQAQQPGSLSVKDEVAPCVVLMDPPQQQAATPGIPLFVAQLPTAELACLQQLQAAVQAAFREVQAAEAAMVAVAQFLREKEAQARSARERAQLAECVLLEQMRQLDEQFHLSKQLRGQQQVQQAVPQQGQQQQAVLQQGQQQQVSTQQQAPTQQGQQGQPDLQGGAPLQEQRLPSPAAASPVVVPAVAPVVVAPAVLLAGH